MVFFDISDIDSFTNALRLCWRGELPQGSFYLFKEPSVCQYGCRGPLEGDSGSYRWAFAAYISENILIFCRFQRPRDDGKLDSESAVAPGPLYTFFLMNNDQVGFPVLTITEASDGIHIRQDRFLADGQIKEEDNLTIW